ncbi:hypothetical protein N7478_002365 [Penicillium angulare]|uniref:uncharacterized protein n=1 Tax=Penicillium angulare TaxID=116970 RepID=UPI002541F399|nr:uncharacterized protein N7478_002365 [Penicillium angulare]KAJ5286679.1 hypothetical protein N7478_002365 [Penicillium angulare]
MTPDGHRRKRVRKGTKSCSEYPSICINCEDRNTPCLSQEYVDDYHSRSTEDLGMAHRMARVESLLETLIHKASHNEIDSLASSSIPAATAQVRSQPVFASLTNDILVQADISPAIKSESLRRQLTAMLLCQEDVDYLFASSHGWWLIQQHMMPYLQNSDENDSRGLFTVSTVSKESPIVITRLLLCISICIQQLSSKVDIQKLQTAAPLRRAMSSIVSFIAHNVTSDDEITGSLEGVECLALQGIYEVNTGNLRRSWLSFRKAITVAQLLGLHRAAPKASQKASEENSDLQHARRSHIWYQISRARIGEQLDSFAKQMSPGWWDIPMSLPSTRTKEASVEFERVMCQIWHFELEILLHLPFMLRAANDQRYEFSHISCLNASRNLIKRWIAIRESHETLLFSNLLNFQGFTAATTLLLGLLSFTTISGHVISQEEQEDSRLIEMVVRSFEGLERDETGKSVSSQSVSIIRTLQNFLRDRSISHSLCLEIPFFGTIKLARSCALQPLEGERLLGANGGRRPSSSRFDQSALSPAEMRRNCISTSTSHAPAKEQGQAESENSGHFVDDIDTFLQLSGGQFQHFEDSYIQNDILTSGWPTQEMETILFDSLVDADLDSL